VLFLCDGMSIKVNVNISSITLMHSNDKGSKQRICTGIIELAGNRPKNRIRLLIAAKEQVTSLILFTNLHECDFRPFLFKFVDDNEISIINHVDFLELRRGTEFRRHYIHGQIGYVGYSCVPLADTTRFNNDEIIS